MKRFFSYVGNYLVLHCEIQLFITLVSLPILMYWGMPLSLASFFGNLFFSPLMTIFLALSCLLFVTELIGMPNAVVVYGLEKITHLITILLEWGTKTWLIAFPSFPIVLLLTIPFICAYFVIISSPLSRLHRITLFTIFLLFIIGARTFFITSLEYNKPHFIPGTNEKLSITLLEDKTYSLHDHGYFSRKANPESYVNFTLKPYLIQNFGITHLAQLELQSPGIRSFKAAHALCSTMTISNIVIRKEKKLFSKYTWYLFYRLKEFVGTNSLHIY